MKRSFVLAAALFIGLAAPALAERAVVRGLDKVTGHARDYALPIGRTVRIGSLEVTARSCHKAAPEESPEVEIYVDVVERNAAGGEGAEAGAPTDVFHGWLFASSPGINALEHPVYDLWAVDCRD